MLEQEAQEQTSQATTKSRSPLLVGAIVVAVIAVIGLGIWAIVAATQTDDLAAATEVTDESMAAWIGDDPAALGALFTDDGVYISPPPWGMGTFEGRAEIEAHAERMMGMITSANRVGELTEVADGVYSGTSDFVANADPYVGDFEVTMEDGLMKRFEWVRVEASSSYDEAIGWQTTTVVCHCVANEHDRAVKPARMPVSSAETRYTATHRGSARRCHISPGTVLV